MKCRVYVQLVGKPGWEWYAADEAVFDDPDVAAQHAQEMFQKEGPEEDWAVIPDGHEPTLTTADVNELKMRG